MIGYSPLMPLTCFVRLGLRRLSLLLSADDKLGTASSVVRSLSFSVCSVVSGSFQTQSTIESILADLGIRFD